MKVCITKDPQGQFSVSVESEEPTPQPGTATTAQGLGADSGGQSAPAGGPGAPEASEDTNSQPAKSLEEALSLAGRLLSQPDPNAGPSPFDQGVAAVLPKKPGMM